MKLSGHIQLMFMIKNNSIGHLKIQNGAHFFQDGYTDYSAYKLGFSQILEFSGPN